MICICANGGSKRMLQMNPDVRKRSGAVNVDQTAGLLHRQTDVPRWVFQGAYPVIRSIVNRRPVTWGLRTRYIRRIFAIGRSDVFRFCLLFGFGLIRSAGLWLKTLFSNQPVDSAVSRIFVGCGVGAEREMWQAFRKDTGDGGAFVSELDPRSFGDIGGPCLCTIVRYLNEATGAVVDGIRRSSYWVVKEHENQWLTAAAYRIGTYVFAKAWFDNLPQGISHVTFITPSIWAYGALDSHRSKNIRVTFQQHGFLNQGLIFPDFHDGVTLTYPEARHINLRSESRAANVLPCQYDDIEKDRHTVVFTAFRLFGKQERRWAESVRRFFQWAHEKGFKIVIRPHPVEGPVFWKDLFPEAVMDEKKYSIKECLQAWRPLFLVSKWTTCTLDALLLGIITVSLSEIQPEAFEDMVFPMDDACLNWPEEADVIENLIENIGQYEAVLQQHRSIAFGK